MDVTINDKTYTDITPHAYRLNPETDDLLYGDELRDEMVVLSEEDRFDEQMNYAGAEKFLLKKNRWCAVTKLREEGGAIFFVGLYLDGTKATHQTEATDGWFVKKSSIAKPAVTSELFS